MAKALKPLVVVLLVLSVISLVLGSILFLQRGEIKDRVLKNEQAVVQIAESLHMDGLDTAKLAEQLKDTKSMQVALNKVSVFAMNRYEELQNTKMDLENKTAELEKTTKELASTKTELAAAQVKITEITDALVQKEAEVAQAKSHVDQLEQDKMALQTQIDDLNNQLVKAEEDMRDLQDQVATLDKIVKETTPAGNRPLPLGLTGKISVVNPDWNFVVLDIGSEAGLVRDAQMLVHRADQLIGKVKISNVQKDMAIAEIITDWAQSPIQEGDDVLY